MDSKSTVSMFFVVAALLVTACLRNEVMGQDTDQAEVIVVGKILRPGTANVPAEVMVSSMPLPTKKTPLHGFVGRSIKVQLLSPDAHAKNDEVVLSTRLGSLGKELLLIELPQDSVTEPQAASALAQQQLDQRTIAMIRKAEHVVLGTIVSIEDVSAQSSGDVRLSEHLPDWRNAVIRVDETLQGASSAGTQMRIRFANSRDIVWYDAPKPTLNQSGVFIIGPGSVMMGDAAIGPEPRNLSGAIAVPGQILPLTESDRIRRLVAQSQ